MSIIRRIVGSIKGALSLITEKWSSISNLKETGSKEKSRHKKKYFRVVLIKTLFLKTRKNFQKHRVKRCNNHKERKWLERASYLFQRILPFSLLRLTINCWQFNGRRIVNTKRKPYAKRTCPSSRARLQRTRNRKHRRKAIEFRCL